MGDRTSFLRCRCGKLQLNKEYCRKNSTGVANNFTIEFTYFLILHIHFNVHWKHGKNSKALNLLLCAFM